MADMQIPKKGFHKEKISEATSVTTPTEPTVSIPGPIDLIERVAKGDGEITESREAVESLRRTEQRLRDVIDTIPTMAWTALPNGSVDFVSRSWLEYTGLPMENLLDGGWSTVAILKTSIGQLRGGRQPWRLENRTNVRSERERRPAHIGGA
jgi:PAS domain-containing protein